MEFENLLLEKRKNLAVIRLNRPNKLNAINMKMAKEIIIALKEVESEHQIRTLIITGGETLFTAGADIIDPPTPKGLWDKLSSRRTYSYYHLIEDLGIPVIAAIGGYCLGGGLELACTCDIRIASENAIIGDAHSKLGVIGGGGSTQRLPRLIGIAKAKELIFSGEHISADEAFKIGLVNKVVPVGELLNESIKLANLYAERPPIVLKLVKQAINNGSQMSLSQGIELEAKCATLISITEDYDEGRKAFLEKRNPNFKGM